MSLLQEIQSGNKAMLANIAQDADTKNAEQLAEEFYNKTGLDLSDCLYRTENREQLENYIKTGELPKNAKGFDYTDLIEKGCYAYNSSRWIKAHYNGNKTLLQIEMAAYLYYCKNIGAKPQNFANLNYFLANVKKAQ